LRLGVACVISLLTLPVAPLTGAAPMPEAYFQVRQKDGAWFFIDPRGEKFFSVGINVVCPADKDKTPGPKYNGLARHGGDSKKWSAAALGRLRSWNFNTIGGWSELRGQPYVLELCLSYSWIDVFDGAFDE